MTTPVPILMYHSVSSDASPSYKRWAVTPEMFAAHMDFLRYHQYTPITVTELAHRITSRSVCLPNRPVVLTFDDGLADFYTGALPVLTRHGFTATLYVTTAFVGHASRWLRREGEGERPMLTWSQIKEIHSRGIECGAHSHTHRELDCLSASEAANEIRHSKDVLEERLGCPVHTFAYPHGYHGPVVRRLAERAGYSSACAVKHAVSSTGDDPFALSRIIVVGDTDVEGLSRLLTGQGLRIAPRGERVQTIGWRLARRYRTMMRRGLCLEAGSY